MVIYEDIKGGYTAKFKDEQQTAVCRVDLFQIHVQSEVSELRALHDNPDVCEQQLIHVYDLLMEDYLVHMQNHAQHINNANAAARATSRLCANNGNLTSAELTSLDLFA